MLYLESVVDMIWYILQVDIIPGISIYLVLIYTLFGSIVWTAYLRRY